MTEDERNLLLTATRMMLSQMEEVAEHMQRSVGIVRGRLREDLPALRAALAPFAEQPEETSEDDCDPTAAPGSMDNPQGMR